MNRLPWDIKLFEQVNLPTVVGKVEVPQFENDEDRIRVLDMPIKLAGSNEIEIPTNIRHFGPIIDKVIEYEISRYGSIEDHYVYVTIDQKRVLSGVTGRRPGAHSDAYIELDGVQVDVTEQTANLIDEVSHTYIVYDCLPTEFFNAPFYIKSVDCESALKSFDEQADVAQASGNNVHYPSNYLLMMTPYVVHRATPAMVDTDRTFVKISISKKQYARVGNTKNLMLNYDFNMKDRTSDVRNHPW